MKRGIGFLFVILVMASKVDAQQDSIIVVHKDPRIDILNAKRELLKPVVKKAVGGLQRGYRVQVANTRNRDEAFKIKAALLRNYGSHKTYIVFQSPYFKVRIGNFISREEANKFKAVLERQYAEGVYIVEDMVEYTPVPDENGSVK